MSVQNTVSQIKLLDRVALSQEEVKDVNFLRTARKHAVLFYVGLTVVIVGGAVGTAIILKDKFDANVSNDQQQQHGFCVQNNNPNC